MPIQVIETLPQYNAACEWCARYLMNTAVPVDELLTNLKEEGWYLTPPEYPQCMAGTVACIDCRCARLDDHEPLGPDEHGRVHCRNCNDLLAVS